MIKFILRNFTFFCLILTSCKDTTPLLNHQKNEKQSFRPTLTIYSDSRADGTIATYSGTAEETYIDKVRFYFLTAGIEDADARLVYYYDEQPQNPDGTIDGQTRVYRFQPKNITGLPNGTYVILAVANADANEYPETIEELRNGSTTKYRFENHFVMTSTASQTVQLTTGTMVTPELTIQRVCAKVSLWEEDFRKTYTDVEPASFNFEHPDDMPTDDNLRDTIDILGCRLVNEYVWPTYWIARSRTISDNGQEETTYFTSAGNVGTTAYFDDPFLTNPTIKLRRGDFQENSNYRNVNLDDTNQPETWFKPTDNRSIQKNGEIVAPQVINEQRFIPLGYFPENNCSYEANNLWFKSTAPAILIKARYKPGQLWKQRKAGNSTFYGYKGSYFATAEAARTSLGHENYDTYEDGICYYLAWILTEPETTDEAPIIANIGINEIGTVRNNYYCLKLGTIGYIGTSVPSSEIPKYYNIPVLVVDMNKHYIPLWME